MGTISVILSTYNGKRYLRELMDTLRNQTRQPDEVLVSDDASSDGTVELVRSYIEEYGLKSWRVIENTKNIGWKANFKRGILASSGDLVFPCDQDDIWDLHKIELMSAVMEDNPEINVLACQVKPFYEGKNEVYHTDRAQRGGELVNALDFDGSDFLYVMRPGCAYCVRSDFARDIQPWWKESYPHDAVLWRFASISGTLSLYGRQLVSFRRHGDNASTRGCMTRETRLADVDYYIDFFKQARDYLSKRKRLDHRRDSMTLRLDAWLNSRRRVLAGDASLSDFRTICAGRSWYSTWKSPLVDLYFFLRPNGRLHV